MARQNLDEFQTRKMKGLKRGRNKVPLLTLPLSVAPRVILECSRRSSCSRSLPTPERTCVLHE